MPEATLINGYAASEAGGAIATWEYSVSSGETVPTLGVPFPNTRVYVLDETLQHVATGEIGEIYVAAPHLSRGYLRQPALTAERFVADPTGVEPGARMYRTGDVGRSLPNGEIAYLGRADDQVKIRGHRVMLGEVEAALHSHNNVQDVAVTIAEAAGESRLVAYVVPREGTPSARDLREFAASRLPAYMVPAAFVWLESMPTTPTGKADRQALPAAGASVFAREVTYVAPRKRIETRLAQIWSRTLGVERVGIHDDFLDLGGDSLSAATIVVALAKELEVEVPLKGVFEYPTVATFAEAYFADAS
jgi:acyl-coenzyme A synthetase/AMP-(fatty) acid ligase/acyl carrier protein